MGKKKITVSKEFDANECVAIAKFAFYYAMMAGIQNISEKQFLRAAVADGLDPMLTAEEFVVYVQTSLFCAEAACINKMANQFLHCNITLLEIAERKWSVIRNPFLGNVHITDNEVLF